MVSSRWQLSTWQRLVATFAGLIAMYTAAGGVVLSGIGEIRGELSRAQSRVQGLRLALELESAVRDQYAHLAHTIIIGDDSHVGYYTAARDRARALAEQMERYALRADERSWVSQIQSSLADLDATFRAGVLPGVIADQPERVRAEHGKALAIVGRAQANANLLANRFSESVEAMQTLVSAVGRRTLLWGLLFLVFAPAVAAAAAVFMSRSIALPLGRLRDGARRLEAGDLDARIALSGPEEFVALGAQLNAMAKALKDQHQRSLQAEKLASVGRLAAGVAHEINNPLAVILGYARLLKRDAVAAAREDLSAIEAEALRCKEIVDGLLDLARPLMPEKDRVDLRALSDEVAARWAATDAAKSVSIRVSGEAFALGDLKRVRQVVVNLVKNAAEAAGPQGSVEVNLSACGSEVELCVRDDGPGFVPSQQERAFEPFFTTKPEGMGLGLAVSRAIARAHGGDLTLGSAAKGGEVVLRLPRAGESS